MKKLFNIVLSLATIALFGLFIYSKIAGVIPFGNLGKFILDYGALILLGLFTFNNLLAKVMSVFFILFLIVVIILLILFIKPDLITNLFAVIM